MLNPGGESSKIIFIYAKLYIIKLNTPYLDIYISPNTIWAVGKISKILVSHKFTVSNDKMPLCWGVNPQSRFYESSRIFEVQILYQTLIKRQEKQVRDALVKKRKPTLRLEQMFYHMSQFRENEGLTRQLAGRQASGHTEQKRFPGHTGGCTG